jgi:hypothetical protein
LMDTQELLETLDLRLLAEEAGARFNSSNSSVCPLHDGSDNRSAFHIYRGGDGLWHWHCFTRCPEGQNGGDAIAFYMRWRGVDFKTALRDLSERVGMATTKVANHPKVAAPPLITPASNPPAQCWQERARAFVEYAEAQIWQPDGQRALAYLHEVRGYTDETIRAWRLGYNPSDVWDKPDRWGLDEDKKVWCSRGIVFPDFRDDQIWTINVRRPRPGDDLAGYINPVDRIPELKFMAIRGGQRGLFGINHLRGLPVLFLVEGEPDTILAWQAIGDLADVATLGGARHRVESNDAMLLAKAWSIIAILDTDQAGDEGIAYLKRVSQRLVAVRPPDHDLTDYWRHGGDLRAWLAASIVDQSVVALFNQLPPEVADQWEVIGMQGLQILLDVANVDVPSPVLVPDPEPVQLPIWANQLPIQIADLPDFCRKNGIDGHIQITDEGLALAYQPEVDADEVH